MRGHVGAAGGALAKLPAAERGQQKISSPSAGTADAGPSGRGDAKKERDIQGKLLFSSPNTSLPGCGQTTDWGTLAARTAGSPTRQLTRLGGVLHSLKPPELLRTQQPGDGPGHRNASLTSLTWGERGPNGLQGEGGAHMGGGAARVTSSHAPWGQARQRLLELASPPSCSHSEESLRSWNMLTGY